MLVVQLNAQLGNTLDLAQLETENVRYPSLNQIWMHVSDNIVKIPGEHHNGY